MTPAVGLPIDYDRIRGAFAETIQAALGLDSNNVVEMQMEGPPAPRPHLPFAAFMLSGIGQSYGQDAHLPTEDEDDWVYSGPRMLTASFQFFADTHEQAFGLCATWHAALDQEPTQDSLMSLGGISVWRREPPQDISAMMYTGYEGRASVSCSFGVQALSTVRMGTVKEVPVSGQVAIGGDTVSVTITEDGV